MAQTMLVYRIHDYPKGQPTTTLTLDDDGSTVHISPDTEGKREWWADTCANFRGFTQAKVFGILLGSSDGARVYVDATAKDAALRTKA